MSNYLIRRTNALLKNKGIVIPPIVETDVVMQVLRENNRTYSNDTTYADDSFIGLTVTLATGNEATITYGGITKTLTATGNVTFGKYLGVDDETPTSGELRISGTYSYYDLMSFSVMKEGATKSSTKKCHCVTAIDSWGEHFTTIPRAFFMDSLTPITTDNVLTRIPPLPNTITSILCPALNYLYALTSTISVDMTILKNTTDTSYDTFPFLSFCPNVKKLIIGKNVTTIAESLLLPGNDTAHPFALSTIEVQSGNANFYVSGGCLMSNAKKLIKATTNAVIPNDTIIIGNFAFANIGLTGALTIPNTVTEIGSNAFSRNVGLTSLVGPTALITLGLESFVGCTSLVSIYLPSIKRFQENVFASCGSPSNKLSMTMDETNPPIITSTSIGTYDHIIYKDSLNAIYVPASAVDTYKADPGWSNYASYIQAIP